MKSVLAMVLLALISNAKAFEQQEEVHPIKELFVVQEGYDSNDNIEITVHAQLPSACYKKSSLSIDKISETSFMATLKIKRKELSSCDSVKNFPVNYTETVSMGELRAGKYKVFYNKQQERTEEKEFSVSKALYSSIDNTHYAPISNAFIPELIYPTADAQVILTGIFHTNCQSFLHRKLKVLRQDNIFVILPTIRLEDGEHCTYSQLPLQKVVSLGKIEKAGVYLIHIRSQSGMAVNRVFYVQKSPGSPIGRQ